jgi:hypothetical protein
VAVVLYDLGGPLGRYFGTGLVTQALVPKGQALTPLIAVQMASSSGARLTKYSNVADAQASSLVSLSTQASIGNQFALYGGMM